MPLPLLPSTFRVAITHGTIIQSLSFTNVMHYGSATLSPAQVLTALDGAVAAGMFDCKLADRTGISAVATKLDNATPSIESVLTNANWNGTGTLEQTVAPAVVVTLKTTQRGRRHTGRVFIGDLAEDKQANGTLIEASRAIMQAAWTTFIANCTSAGIPLQVASYGYTRQPGDPADGRPDFPPSVVPVTAATVQTILGTQRRRQSRLRQ